MVLYYFTSLKEKIAMNALHNGKLHKVLNWTQIVDPLYHFIDIIFQNVLWATLKGVGIERHGFRSFKCSLKLETPFQPLKHEYMLNLIFIIVIQEWCSSIVLSRSTPMGFSFWAYLGPLTNDRDPRYQVVIVVINTSWSELFNSTSCVWDI